MAVARVVLDTDILSAIMRQNPVVVPKAREYLAEHHRFKALVINSLTISPQGIAWSRLIEIS